jgi:hypothetical protein
LDLFPAHSSAWFHPKIKIKIAVHGPLGQEQLQVRLSIRPDHQAGELCVHQDAWVRIYHGRRRRVFLD